jgi:hypothetical protein
VVAIKLVTMNNHEPSRHLGFRFLRCCGVKATLFRSSACICDRESRSPESSSLAILHRKRTNKVFGKRSSRLLACFFKFFITTHLPLRRTRIEGHHLQRELHQTDHRRQGIVSHIRFLLSNHVLPIRYVDLRIHDFAR